MYNIIILAVLCLISLNSYGAEIISKLNQTDIANFLFVDEGLVYAYINKLRDLQSLACSFKACNQKVRTLPAFKRHKVIEKLEKSVRGGYYSEHALMLFEGTVKIDKLSYAMCILDKDGSQVRAVSMPYFYVFALNFRDLKDNDLTAIDDISKIDDIEAQANALNKHRLRVSSIACKDDKRLTPIMTRVNNNLTFCVQFYAANESEHQTSPQSDQCLILYEYDHVYEIAVAWGKRSSDRRDQREDCLMMKSLTTLPSLHESDFYGIVTFSSDGTMRCTKPYDQTKPEEVVLRWRDKKYQIFPS